jgi:hypothetical protein
MAGAGYKLFATGDVLTAAQVNTYLNEQTVMVFADSAARTTALSGVLAEGMMSYLQDTDSVEVYDGSAWTAIGGGSSPLTTKGDLYTFSTVDARLGVGANGTVLTAASGEATGLQWAAPSTPAAVSHVRAISSTTSVPAATWTKVIFGTESYDTLSEFASSRFTAASTGYYNVSAGVCSDAGAIILGSQMIVAIYKNGAAFQLGSSYTYPGGVTARGSAFISTGLSLTTTDYIEIYVLQSLTGGTLALSNSDGQQTFVSIDRLQD